AYNGLGDIVVLVFYGFVEVMGSYYVEACTVSPAKWWASVPRGAIGSALLEVDNQRDARADVKAGKRTLEVRVGTTLGKAEYMLLLLAAFLTPCVMFALGLKGPWVFLPLVSAPLGVPPLRRMLREQGAALNPALGSTARLQLVFGLLFALGLY